MLTREVGREKTGKKGEVGNDGAGGREGQLRVLLFRPYEKG